MRNRSKLLLTAITAAFILASAVSTASATRLSISERELRLNWTRFTWTVAGTNIECEVALLAVFHSSTIRKVAGALIAAVNSASLTGCVTDGSATVLQNTLPWHLSYDGFSGRLPIPTGINYLLIGPSFSVQNEGITCLAQADRAEPVRGIANIGAGQITSVTADPTAQIDIDDESFFCALAGDVSVEGSGTARTPGGGLVFVRLI